MNPLALLKLVPAKFWLVLGIIAVTVATLGYTYRLGGEAPRAKLALIAEAQAKQALHELRNKERSDAEYDRRSAALQRAIAELQQRPLDPVGERPANSKCPAEQVCYDRPEFERAYRELAREVREVAAEGSALALELELAEEWADGN